MPTTVKKTKYGTYTCRVAYMKGGKRRFKRFTEASKSLCRQKALNFERELSISNFKKDNQSITLKEAVDRYLTDIEDRIEVSSYHSYRSKQKNIINKMPDVLICDIDDDWLQTVFDADYHCPKSLMTVMGIIKPAVRRYRKDFNPNIKYKRTPPKKKEVLPPSHNIKELLQAVKGTDFDLPLTMIVVTGCRISEIQGFEWQDIDWEQGTITVNRVSVKVNGYYAEKAYAKTEAGNRVISLPKPILEKLLPFKGEPTERICKLTNDQIRHKLEHYEKSVGISPFISAHDFRHYAVSIMHYENLPKAYGMRRIGHITEKMYDEQYVNPIDDYEKMFNDKINEAIVKTFF